MGGGAPLRRPGDPLLFIGYAGHEEVNGTFGEAPDSTILVQSEDEARVVDVPEPEAGVLPDPDHTGRR